MRFIVATILCPLVLTPIGCLAAQRDTLGAIEGTVRERSSFRSVLAARVAVRRLEPDTMVGASVAPDSRGRFRVDSLPPGRYRASVVSPALDSVHVEAPAEEVTI